MKIIQYIINGIYGIAKYSYIIQDNEKETFDIIKTESKIETKYNQIANTEVYYVENGVIKDSFNFLGLPYFINEDQYFRMALIESSNKDFSINSKEVTENVIDIIKKELSLSGIRYNKLSVDNNFSIL